jgi:hypothetical protein
MSYSVRWRDVAERSLLFLLLRAVDKPALWAVARSVDEMLQSDPRDAGESREGNFRILFVRPLCVFFQVDDASRTVVIEQVGLVGE